MSFDESKPYIITVPEVLTPAECATLIERIEAAGPAIAPITTFSGPKLRPDIRNNERVMFDDVELAALLLERVRPRVPPEFLGMWLCGANERLRCYRYKPGMRFAPHADGAFYRNAREQSFYSFLVYLNEGFGGGNTTFLVEPEVSITPETGKGLLFQHPLIHEGSVVTEGVKYVLRSDIMYRAAY